MNIIKLATGVGALFALTACPVTDGKCADTGDSGDCITDDSGGGDDSGDSTCDTYAGATYLGVDTSLCASPGNVEPVLYDCEGNNSDWWYDIYTVGWTNGVDLLIYQTGSENPWDENHPIASYDFDEDGYWDNLYTELDGVDDPNDVTDGVTTLYNCDSARQATLTWQIVVYDVNNAATDCAVWGDDPSFVNNCTDISSWF